MSFSKFQCPGYPRGFVCEGEDRNDYKKGGYHPVGIGEKYDGRYTIVKRLGWGHFSTVWYAFDELTSRYVAIKFQKSDVQYTNAAMDEIKILSEIKEAALHSGQPQKVVFYLDHFFCIGPNGRHVCLVFEPLGKNLLDLIKQFNYAGIPLDACKQIIRDCLEGLAFVHSHNIIHTDIKPENFLMNATIDHHPLWVPEQTKLGDLGNGCWTTKHFTDDITTRQYRAPEVIVGAGYDESVDIFSIACLLFELITGDFLFDPKEPHPDQKFTRNEDQLAQMIELMGPMPEKLYKKGKFSKRYLTPDGNPRNIDGLEFWDLLSVLTEKYKLPIHEAEPLADFLGRMLALDPDQRDTAEQLLSHPWLFTKSTVYNVGECRKDAQKIAKASMSEHQEASSPLGFPDTLSSFGFPDASFSFGHQEASSPLGFPDTLSSFGHQTTSFSFGFPDALSSFGHQEASSPHEFPDANEDIVMVELTVSPNFGCVHIEIHVL
jgi:serine/threonine-protein kinase SRPK3